MNPFVFAQTQTPPVGTSIFSMLPMFAIIIFIFYFIVYRRQQNKKTMIQNLLDKIWAIIKDIFT